MPYLDAFTGDLVLTLVELVFNLPNFRSVNLSMSIALDLNTAGLLELLQAKPDEFSLERWRCKLFSLESIRSKLSFVGIVTSTTTSLSSVLSNLTPFQPYVRPFAFPQPGQFRSLLLGQLTFHCDHC